MIRTVNRQAYREFKPDGVEEMRRERAQRHARQAVRCALPLAVGILVLSVFFIGQLSIGIWDGLSIAAGHIMIIGPLAVFAGVNVRWFWRQFPRVIGVVHIVRSLGGAGLWLRSNTGPFVGRSGANARHHGAPTSISTRTRSTPVLRVPRGALRNATLPT